MCSCGLRGGTGPVWGCGEKCCGSPGGKNIFDMLQDTCAKTNWNHCKAKIYGKVVGCEAPGCAWLSNISPCCRFPPRRCPPPPPPPRDCCSCHRCNPNRACGFIIKPSNYPCGRPECCSCLDGCPDEQCCCPDGGCSHAGVCSTGGVCCCAPKLPCCSPNNPPCVSNNCCFPPACCPIPDPICPCRGTCSVHCRPAWRATALRAAPYCADPPPLPPRSYRYKCWVSQFQGKVDSNLVPSRYSSLLENCGNNIVIAEPPDCESSPPCPCHPCCSCS